MERANRGPERPNQPFILPLNTAPTAAKGNAQLPASVQLPQEARLRRMFGLLMRQLTNPTHQLLHTPLTLNICQVSNVLLEVQIHIPTALTNDVDLCREVCLAIHKLCGSRQHTVAPLSFSGDQSSTQGVATFQVQPPFHPDVLDAVLADIVTLGKFLVTVDGNLDRFASVLSDQKVGKALYDCLFGPDAPFSVSGKPGALHIERVSWKSGLLLEGVRALCNAGFKEMALLILSGGLRDKPWAADHSRAGLLALYVDLVTSDASLLAHPENIKRATELVCVSFGATKHGEPFANLKGCQLMVDTGVKWVEFLIEHEQIGTALDVLELMNRNRPGPGLDSLAGLVQLLAIADPSPETISRLRKMVQPHKGDIVPNKLMTALDEWLSQARQQLDAEIVLNHPAVASLADKGFTFTNLDFHSITPKKTGSFDGSKHAEELLQYLNSILTEVSDLPMIINWGLPVLDFLIDHCAQLPQSAQKHLQACLPALAMAMGKANPQQAHVLVLRVQRLTQVCLLQSVLDSLLGLRKYQARNVAAWAYINRNALFASLPSALVDAAFKQALAQVGLTAVTVQNVPVDVQQASETLKPKLASIAAQLTAPGAIIASAGMAEVRDALFQCLKTLTFKNDIQWQAELLEQVGKTIDDAADLPLVQEIVQSAVSTLKAHLDDGSISGQAKLFLYGAVIDFIQDVADQSAGKDNKSAMHIWAIKALEAMANDEVLAEVMEGIDPGARLWPTWAATELKLGHEIQGIDQCIFFLNDCKPSSPEGSNYRFDRMCTKAIELYTITINIQDLDGRQTDALKLYAIWLPFCKPMESIDLTTQPSVATILALIKSLSTSLMRNEDLGVTTQGDAMLVVLLVQLLQHNPNLAREHLEKVSQNSVLLNRYPLLGVAAHLLFARHYRSIQDRANEVEMVAAAHLLLPPQSENEAFRAASNMILAFIDNS